MKKSLIIFSLLTSSLLAHSQTYNSIEKSTGYQQKITKFKSENTFIAPRSPSDYITVKKNAVSFNFGGTTPLIGITYERLLSKNMSIELGIGKPSVGFGIKFFPYGIKTLKIRLHLGLTAVYVNSGDNEIFGLKAIIIYLPIGLSYYGKNGFNFGFDLGPGILNNYSFYNNHYLDSNLIPYGNLKLGIRM